MYDCIIVNYLDISKRVNLPKPSQTHKSFEPALLYILPTDIVSKINSLTLGEQRINYISSEEFKNNIHTHFFFFYHPKRKICILDNSCLNYIEIILNSTFNYLDPKTILWVSFNLNNLDKKEYEQFVNFGFNSPYITSHKPDKSKIEKSLALCRKNILSDPDHNKDNTLNKIEDIVRHKNEPSCNINIRLSNNAISFLKSTSKKGVTVNKDGSQSQKELTGELNVRSVINENGKIIYIIDVLKNSIQSGGEENVDVNPTRYNFHSHPEEAYIRHSVHKGWPSLTDYLGFLQLGKNTIIHIVCSLEGMYVLSFTKHWGDRLDKVSKRFIKNNYRIQNTENISPEQYTERINKIEYEGKPIYFVQFYPWDKAGNTMNVYYSKIGMSCMPTEKIKENYNKLHI